VALSLPTPISLPIYQLVYHLRTKLKELMSWWEFVCMCDTKKEQGEGAHIVNER